MTTWRGFYRESREYCGYGVKSKREKALWWLALPVAWARFQWFGFEWRVRRAIGRHYR